MDAYSVRYLAESRQKELWAEAKWARQAAQQGRVLRAERRAARLAAGRSESARSPIVALLARVLSL